MNNKWQISDVLVETLPQYSDDELNSSSLCLFVVPSFETSSRSISLKSSSKGRAFCRWNYPKSPW